MAVVGQEQCRPFDSVAWLGCMTHPNVEIGSVRPVFHPAARSVRRGLTVRFRRLAQSRETWGQWLLEELALDISSVTRPALARLTP